MSLDEVGLARLRRRQDGVVSRSQLLDLGALPHDVRRLVRRRELVAVHAGVYVDHTGSPTRSQRQWAAVLALAPAALHRETALEAAGLTQDRPFGLGAQIHVLVDAARTPIAPAGVRVERVRDAASWVLAGRRPPRATVEFAGLKVASGRDEAGAVAVLADVCRQGLTTPGRLLAALEQLPRLPGRADLVTVLVDVDAGVHSVLEQRFLARVERAHGLPAGERQVRVVTGAGTVMRDVRYRDHQTLVELDGRFGHIDADDRWDDLDRDVAAAVSGEITLRLGWRQVLQPCRTAVALGQVLHARGWILAPTACSPTCLAVGGRSGTPAGADHPRTGGAAD